MIKWVPRNFGGGKCKNGTIVMGRKTLKGFDLNNPVPKFRD